MTFFQLSLVCFKNASLNLSTYISFGSVAILPSAVGAASPGIKRPPKAQVTAWVGSVVCFYRLVMD